MNSKTESKEELMKNMNGVGSDNGSEDRDFHSPEPPPEGAALTAEEKKFLLLVERGDVAGIKRLIDSYRGQTDVFSVDCMDPLGRSALIMAIENENYELIQLLLEEGVQVKDALLHAIKEEYVEAVELLLEWEETNHQPGTPYSWEAADRDTAKFTPDITPLILAAHRDNYEILKILLDRGATLPVPHDIKCGCDICIKTVTEDSLRYSMSRINAYKALASPSLICLSSSDPFLTAFELSWELRRLARAEAEFREEYNVLRAQCQEFATTLLGHARTSEELQTILNHKTGDEESGWEPGEKQDLERLKLAIKYKQKQLLATMWYDGLPGFRRKTLVKQILEVGQLGASFPLFSMIYMFAPQSEKAKFMKKPFVKFILHSCSYIFFLSLLAAASQRLEFVVLEWFGPDWVQDLLKEWQRKERGALPGLVEFCIVVYVQGWIWAEIKSLWNDGLAEYLSDLWNIVDLIMNTFYVTWIGLRAVAFYVVKREEWAGLDPYYKREDWDMFDPMLLSEGMFGAAMIFSFLKLVHVFSINPHLGPLQISLGRMIVDIIKFFFIYTLVLFAFGCGLNQLLWYYADLEKKACYSLPDPNEPNPEAGDSCFIWRRFANLFETSQSLFWASFGLVELEAFELQGIQGFTRFWGLLMFGSYSVINVIVLLNMLIAMMSTSYQIISERSDMEWKFARSKLWISYFDEGATVPAPFNIIPTMKALGNLLGRKKELERKPSTKRRNAYQRYLHITRLLVRRYVSAEEQKRVDQAGITEDDVNEIRQDISSFRYELVDILKLNGMRTPNLSGSSAVAGKKGKVMERRLMKDFQIGCVEGAVKEALVSDKGEKNIFSRIAKAVGGKKDKTDWNERVRRSSSKTDPIGSKQTSLRRRSQRRKRVEVENAALFSMDPEILAEYNPKLQDVTPATRVAYAKFKTRFLISHADEQQSAAESPKSGRNSVGPGSIRSRSATVRRDTTKRPLQSSLKSTGSRGGGGGGGGGSGTPETAPKPLGSSDVSGNQLDKSNEKIDETPVLQPIRSNLSLKRIAEEKERMMSPEKKSGDGTVTTATAGATKSPAPAGAAAKPPVPSPTPSPVQEKPKETVSPATPAPTSSPPPAATVPSPAKPSAAAQVSPAKADKKDHVVVNMDESKPSTSPRAGPSRLAVDTPSPSDASPQRSASPSGKSAVTGQTRTGWL